MTSPEEEVSGVIEMWGMSPEEGVSDVIGRWGWG